MTSCLIAVLFFIAANLKATSAHWDSRFDDIEFHVYTSAEYWRPKILKLGDDDALDDFTMRPEDKTIVYIHGWLESATAEAATEIRDAYLEYMECNVILVDWSEFAQSWYFMDAGPNTIAIGNHIAKMLIWLKDNNCIYISNLHIIGFSLGAHVAGFVGKALAPRKVSRITGLDPAGPGFEGNPRHYRLDESDALFVDVIHTNAGVAGISSPIGHVDFYPHGGSWQNGCGLDLVCHHKRAWRYYVKSISSRIRYPAMACDFYNEYPRGCDGNNDYPMGFPAEPNKYGIFYIYPR